MLEAFECEGSLSILWNTLYMRVDQIFLKESFIVLQPLNSFVNFVDLASAPKKSLLVYSVDVLNMLFILFLIYCFYLFITIIAV